MDELSQAMNLLEQAIADMRNMPTFQPQTDFTETDEDHTVEVTVDAEGKIANIRVFNGWEDRIEASMLADRINMTLGRANLRKMGVDPDFEGPDGTEAPELIDLNQTPPQAEVTAEDRKAAQEMSEQSYAEFLQRVENTKRNRAEVMEDIQRKFDELDAVLAGAATPSEDQRYFSDNQMVSIESDGVSMGNVEIKDSWLNSPRSGLTVTQCLNEALQQVPQSGVNPSDFMNILK